MTTMPPGGRTALNTAIDHENGVVKTTPRLRAQLEKLGYIARVGRAWKVTPKGIAAVKPAAPHQPGDQPAADAQTHHAHDANTKIGAALADLQQLVAAMRADTVDCADIEAVARRLTHLGDQIGRRAALVDLIRSDQ